LSNGRLVAERRIDDLPDRARTLEALYLELTTRDGS
jgi:hypothetical protein